MDTSRRSFLASSGRALGAGWVAFNWPAIATAAEHAHAAATAGPQKFAVLSAAQAREVEAVSAQIIPTDDLPGAREAGAVYFIDQALGGFYAVHRSEFLGDYAEFAAQVAKENDGLRFSDLVTDRQIAHLKHVDGTRFFGSVRFLTVLGFLASPQYGGNRNGVGWQVIGFQDEHVFTPPFGYYDRDYPGFVPYPGSVPYDRSKA